MLIEGRTSSSKRSAKARSVRCCSWKHRVEERLISSSDPNWPRRRDDEAFVHELRYSRKITHKNVIRIYDFCTSRAITPSPWNTFVHHAGRRDRHEKPVSSSVPVKFRHRHRRPAWRGPSGGNRASRPEAAKRAHRHDQPSQIVDFGVAAAQSQGDTQLTKTGTSSFPEVHGPEQILAKKSRERADI